MGEGTEEEESTEKVVRIFYGCLLAATI